MFLSEWREFPSAPCLAGKKKLDDSSRLHVVETACVPDMLPSLFLPGRAKDLSAPRLYCYAYTDEREPVRVPINNNNNNNNNNNVANKDLGRLLTLSDLIRLEVSLMVSPGFLYYNNKTKYLQRTLSYIRSVCANRRRGKNYVRNL